MIHFDAPALVLAPMDGITDAPMRAVQSEIGCYSYAVSEFVRVSEQPLPQKVFRKEVPEICHGSRTPAGLLTQVQILGGHPERMALSALRAVQAGAAAIDINFGCPAPTVNRNDGGASLLKHPERIYDIVSTVRSMVPPEIPVSAKLRLGWDDISSIDKNAEMAAKGGATWLTIHARTRIQGYAPPVYWEPIGRMRRNLDIPVVANGDIYSLDDFLRCQEVTGCQHFMVGRGALARPGLSHTISRELGLYHGPDPTFRWQDLLLRLEYWVDHYKTQKGPRPLNRIKQWLRMATRHGDLLGWDSIKIATSCDEIYDFLAQNDCVPPMATK